MWRSDCMYTEDVFQLPQYVRSTKRRLRRTYRELWRLHCSEHLWRRRRCRPMRWKRRHLHAEDVHHLFRELRIVERWLRRYPYVRHVHRANHLRRRRGGRRLRRRHLYTEDVRHLFGELRIVERWLRRYPYVRHVHRAHHVRRRGRTTGPVWITRDPVYSLRRRLLLAISTFSPRGRHRLTRNDCIFLYSRKWTMLVPMTMRIAMLASLLQIGWLAPVAAGEITSKQAKEILQELKQIRQLLARQQLPQQAMQALPVPVAAAAPDLVKLKLGTEFALGRADAPVTIVEFNDLQCPFCSRFHADAFVEIRKQYIDTGKVRFINRDLPLDELHPQATRAALAARCAGDQGKYWEVAGKIIANNSALSTQLVDQFAKESGIDATMYSSCMESNTHLDAIRENAASGRAIGLTGTPSFVVGRVNGDTLYGEKIIGAMPFSAFDAAIKNALAN